MKKKFKDQALTASRFAKVYWSFLWRSTLLSMLLGIAVAGLIIGANIPVESLDEPVAVLLMVVLALGIDWFVRYRVLAKVAWSDFRVGLLKGKGDPEPITPWAALSMTGVSTVVTMLFTAGFVFFMNMMLADVDNDTIDSLIPWVNAAQTALGIWVEYLVLTWYMRYNLWIGGVLVLYGSTAATRAR
jgi:hypothetical protein